MMGRMWAMVALASAAVATDPASHAAQVAEGRAQYELVVREGSRPRYGACWTSALAEVTEGCKHLDDETQSRLALGLANCFLERAGQRTYPCPPSSTIAACLEEVDGNAFTAYSNFFTHTQNMCYFLQSQVWQEEQEATMHSLADNSAKVSESLAEASLLQRRLVERQEESLDFHRELASGIAGAKGNVLDMLEEFKISTYEQKNLIFQVFDKVSILQNLVVSEMSWLYTVIFYSACLLVIYLATATRRTADARLWLFVVLTANFAVERLVVKWSLPQAGEADVMNLSGLVHDRVWLCRQVAIAVAAVVLAVVAVRFKDYNKINNQLLEEIRKQNLDLKRSMENYQADSRDKYNLGRRQFVDSHDGQSQPQLHLSEDIRAMLSEDTGYRGDEEDDEFSDSDDSFNSTRSDRTFEPEDFNFSTAAGSRETTPTPQNDINLAMEEINSSLVSSTPVKKVPLLSDSLLDNSLRYNLRPRSRASTSSVTSNMSRLSSVGLVSPVIKSSQVKTLTSTQKRNQNKLKMLQSREEFSADES